MSALDEVKFQLSLLHFISLGAESPQAQQLESLLHSEPVAQTSVCGAFFHKS